MKRLVNVCLIVLATAFLTWRLNNASATRVGLAKTAPQDFATSTADLTAAARTLPAFAKPAGKVIDAKRKIATPAAASMANAKMARVFVSVDGMDFIALLKAVREDVLIMVVARPTSKGSGAVIAILDGKGLIVVSG